jgi:glucose/arabinose dehydrogenase
VLDPKDPNRLARHEVYFSGEPPQGLGRVREVITGPDGALWVTTSNCDGRGTCPPEKDRIVRIVQ